MSRPPCEESDGRIKCLEAEAAVGGGGLPSSLSSLSDGRHDTGRLDSILLPHPLLVSMHVQGRGGWMGGGGVGPERTQAKDGVSGSL
jgi:hypothetical protein